MSIAIVVTALVVSLHYRRKYDPIFRQLSELLSEQEKGVAPKAFGKPTYETVKTTGNPTDLAHKGAGEEDKVVEDADAELFTQLTDAIRNEQLYTMPRFGRKDLMKRFHLTGKRVSTAFSMAGTSVPEFIRDCRLEYARQLIDERPDMTLVEIATVSGFVHASTFTVDFKNKYGVSPTKYREEGGVRS